MSSAKIPRQSTTDWTDPEQMFLWALIHLPNVGGSAMVAHPDVLRGWSKHLWECGFIHVGQLHALANDDGWIHVSQLPEQQIKYQPPYRGPQNIYNPAGKWVPIDEPDPEPVRVQDMSKLTREEQEAAAWQLRQLGVVQDAQPEVDMASVEE